MENAIIRLKNLKQLSPQELNELRQIGVNTDYVTNAQSFRVHGVGSHEQEGIRKDNINYSQDND